MCFASKVKAQSFVCQGNYQNRAAYFDALGIQRNLKILDNDGTEYLPSEISYKNSGTPPNNGFSLPAPITCVAGMFTVHFSNEPTTVTNYGFSHSTLGAVRRALVCQVFTDLSVLLAGANDGRVHIWVGSDQAYTASLPNVTYPSGAGALASQFYVAPTGLNNTIIEGEVYKTLRSGQNSYTGLPAGFVPASSDGIYHGYVAIDFSASSNWFLDFANTAIGTSQNDLYSVVLHEAFHTLGFASNITSTGQSKWSIPDVYYRFDKFLSRNTATNRLISYIGVNDWQYNLGNPALPQACGNPNNILFNGTNLTNQSVYNATNWSDGSNLSHFGCSGSTICDAGYNAPTSNFVMNPCAGAGVASIKRRPNAQEVRSLCDLGYALRSTSGTIAYGNTPSNTSIYQTYTACGSSCIAVGVHDAFTAAFNTPIIQNLSTVLSNDINGTNGSVNEMFLITPNAGNVTFSGTAFTYTPSNTFSGLAVIGYYPRCSGSNENGSLTYIFINVLNPPLPLCNLTGACNENLIHLGSFESFVNENQLQDVLTNGTNFFGFNTPVFDNTPNLFTGGFLGFNCGTSAQLAIPAGSTQAIQMVVRRINNINQPEGPSFELCRPIPPNSSATIRFQASMAAACTSINPNISLDFLGQAPLANTNIYTTPGTVLPTINIPIVNTSNTNPQFGTYQRIITNNTTVPITHVVMSSFIATTNFPNPPGVGMGSIVVDNISLTLNASPLTISSTISSSTPCVGTTVQVNYTICNPNNFSTTATTMDLSIPNSLTLIPTTSIPNNTVSIPSMQAGACIQLQLQLQVNNNALSGLPIAVSLNPRAGNCFNGNQNITTITPISNPLSIVKSVSNNNPAIGSTLTFNIQVCNNSLTPVNNVTITDVLPTGLSIQNLNGFTQNGNSLTRIVSAPAAGSIGSSNCQVFSFTATINNNCALGGNSIINCASIQTASNNCPALQSCVTMNIQNATPTVSITQSGSSTTCANATLLTANPSPAGAYTYQWRLNGVNIVGATAATFSPTQSGSYSVVATNSAGCTGTSSATIINIPPPIIATLSGITATCLGGATPLTATPSGSGFSYQWSTNTDGLSNSNTAYGYTSLQNPNTFSVTVTAPSGCTASATFNTNFDFYCCGSGTNPGELRINNFNTFATTNVSQVSSSISNASTIYLWGTLNINSSINLTYKTFLMGPNARIIIQPGVNVVLSHDVFRPCTNYMWDGIYQQTTSSTSPSSLQVDKSELYSAKNAIVIEGNFSTNRILGNKFFDNYIGVRYINHQSNAQCENRSNQYIPMQPFANLIHPYINRINSWKGVDIENSNGVVIGTNNLFNRLDFGIFAANSSFSALGNTFTNIARNPAINLSGNAIYAEDMNLSSPQIRSATIGSPAQPNTFTDCYQAASLFNMDAQVRNNTMTNMTNGIRIAWCTNGNLGTPNTINIADNDININQTPNTNNTNWGNQFFQYKYGINCVLNTRAAITISHNTINLPQAQSVANQTVMGVVMDEFSNTTANNYTLNNANHVEGGDIAYRLNNIRGAMLEGNEAINHPNGANYAGFWLDNSPANTLQCNNVNAVNTQYSTRGYRMSVSTGNLLHTNKVANAFRGIEASGNCIMSNGLQANVLNNNFLGLVVRDGGRIGTQGLTSITLPFPPYIINFNPPIPLGNRFAGNGYDLCSYASTIPPNDRYVYNGILNPNLPNSNIQLLLSTPIPTQLGSPTFIQPNQGCAPFNFLVAPPVTENELALAKEQEEVIGMLQTAQDQLNYPVYSDVMKFLSEKELYEKVRESMELKQDVVLNTFFETKEDENLGKIADLEKKLQYLNWNDNPTADENQIRLEKLQKSQAALNEKDQIQTQSDIEIKWKEVAHRYIKMMQSEEGDLESIDKDFVYSIAILCPYNYGPAVYQARFLLNALDAGVWINDEEACQYAFKTEQEDPLLALSKSKQLEKKIELFVFPNPAKDYLRLNYTIGDNSNLSFALENILGQRVLPSATISSWGADNVNISGVANGVYLLKVMQHESIVDTRKIVINR